MKKDRPKDVIRAGKNATVGLRKVQRALDHAQALAALLQDQKLPRKF